MHWRLNAQRRSKLLPDILGDRREPAGERIFPLVKVNGEVLGEERAIPVGGIEERCGVDLHRRADEQKANGQPDDREPCGQHL